MAQAPRRGLFGGRVAALQNDTDVLRQLLDFANPQPVGLSGLLASGGRQMPLAEPTGPKGSPRLSEAATPGPQGEGFWSRLRTGIRDMGRAYQGLPTSEDERFGSEFAGLLGATDPKMREAAYDQMQQAIARRAGQGGDVAPYTALADSFRQRGMVDAAARTLPGQLQAYGRLAPQAGAGFAFDQNASDLYGGPDGAYFRAAKGAGPMERLQGPQPGYGWQDNPQGGVMPTPGGPADPAYQQKLQYGRTLGQIEATPPDPVEPMGQSEVVAQVLQRARTVGVEGLSEAERRIFDYATTRPEPQNPFAMFGMGGPPSTVAPQPQPSQPRRPAAGGVARPQSQADFNALPRGARYIDPDDGQLYEKP